MTRYMKHVTTEKIVSNAAKLTLKTTVKDKTKTVIKSSISQNDFNSAKGTVINYFKGKLDDKVLSALFGQGVEEYYN